MRIPGSVFIVTGGSSGLGEATTMSLASKGAKIAIFDRDEERGQIVAKRVGDERAMFVTVDVTSEESIKKAIEATVERFGNIHGVVNCAGISAATKVYCPKRGIHSLEIFDFVIKVNLVGAFNVSRLAVAQMVKQEPNANGERGVIINVASVAAYEGQQGQCAYAASKGGVVAMTLPMARELGQYGIRVNTIAPGIFSTPMMRAASEKVRKRLLADSVFPKRMGNPNEFAQMATSLIENTFMNGATVRLDGGIRYATTTQVKCVKTDISYQNSMPAL